MNFDSPAVSGEPLTGAGTTVPLDSVTEDLQNLPVSGVVGAAHPGGFEWSEQAYIFVRNLALSSAPAADRNGFYNGVTSGNQAIFNNASAPFFVSRDGSWTLESASFTGAWHEDLEITITDQSPGSTGQPRQVQFTLGEPTVAQAVQIGLDDVTRVKFSVSGGIEFGFPGTPASPPAARIVVIDDLVWSRLEPVTTVVFDAAGVASQRAAITAATNLLWTAPAGGAGGAGGLFGNIDTMDRRLGDLQSLASASGWQQRAGDAVDAAERTFADALEDALLAADAASKTEDRVTQDHAEAVRIHAVSSLLARDIGSDASIVTAFERLVAAGAPLDGLEFSGEQVREYHDRISGALDGIRGALADASAVRADAGNMVVDALRGTVFTSSRPGGAPTQSDATVAARLQVFEDLGAAIADTLSQAGNGVDPAVIVAAAADLQVGLERFQSDSELATSRFALYAQSAEAAAVDGIPGVAETALIESAVERPIATLQTLRRTDLDATEAARRVDVLLAGSQDRMVSVDANGGQSERFLDRVHALTTEIEALRALTGDRFQDAQSLKQALDEVHASLIGLLAPAGADVSRFSASVASVRADASASGISDRLSALDQVAGDAATVAPLVEVQRAAIEGESATALAAVTTAADAARHAAEAAVKLADAAREFQERFEARGFDATEVARSASLAQAAAEGAGRARDAAAEADRSMRQDLFAAMPSQGQGGWAAWVQQVSDRSRATLTAVSGELQSNGADADALNQQLAAYSRINALGARAVGESGAGVADELAAVIKDGANGGTPWSGGELSSLERLRVLEGKVTAAESTLASVDASAARALAAADSAEQLSLVAVARRDDAERGRNVGDQAFTFGSARLSRTAADLTAVRTNQVHVEVGVTTALVNSSVVTEVAAMTKDGAVAAIDGFAAALETADATVNGDRAGRSAPGAAGDSRPEYAPDSLRGQIEFYDDVVKVLAGRVDPSLVMSNEYAAGQPVTHGQIAGGAASQMDAVRALAQNAARELARQADQAMQMAERGRSNADRFFGRSLSTYVTNAQQQHVRAYEAWQRADVAAREAKGFADELGTNHGIAATGIAPVAPSAPSPGGGPIVSGGG